MKKVLYLIFFCFLPFIGSPQTYIPLPMENARWKHTYTCHDLFSQTTCSAQYQTEITGDTLIGSFYYSKLVKSGGHGCYTLGGCGTFAFGPFYVGALRQDTAAKTVYIRLPMDSIDRVLYDFSQQIGDTLNSILHYYFNTITISGYDSILIDTVYHRRMNFNFMPFFYDYCFIEGIGSNSGLLEDFVSDQQGSLLDCVFHNGQTVYPYASYNCSQVYTGIEKPEIQHCKIIPNPFRESFSLELDQLVPDCELELYDIFSRKVYQQHYENVQIIKTTKLQWKPGVYFFRIMNNEIILASGKVIAE